MNYLLVPGLGRTSIYWEDFPERLKQADPEAEIVCLDLPDIFNDIRSMTENLRKRWAAKKKPGPTILISISLGGVVALDWAHRYPEDFERVVAINTSVREINSSLDRVPWLRLLPLLFHLTSRPERREKYLLELTVNDPEIRETYLQIRQARAVGRRGVKWKSLWRQLRAAATFEPPTNHKNPRLIFLCGAHDRLVDARCSTQLATYYDGRQDVHPTGGHELHLEAPDWILERILNLEATSVTTAAPPSGTESN